MIGIKKNKKILFVVIISIFILIPMSKKIITQINLEYKKTHNNIKVGQEFLIYKKDNSQGNKRVYMTISKIVKDEPILSFILI